MMEGPRFLPAVKHNRMAWHWGCGPGRVNTGAWVGAEQSTVPRAWWKQRMPGACALSLGGELRAWLSGSVAQLHSLPGPRVEPNS